MFSDTHFHFNILREDENFSRQSILEKMARNGCKFALDIGVKADDFLPRIKLFKEEISKIENPLRKKIEDFIFFSAGIWPDEDSIKNRAEKIAMLEKIISDAKSNLKNSDSEKEDSSENTKSPFDKSVSNLFHRRLSSSNSENFFGEKLVALGECGLDHHWNVAGPDARSETDFGEDLLFGERELFEAQIFLAKKFSLPVIVHSRDAAAQTLECIKNAGYHNGIIHCFSYGIEEARAFLDLGWHISFSGSVTYTKKSRAEQMRELLRFVPDDRILVETDSPYLAPVPMRGKPNNPTFIEHTYRHIASARGVEVERLCESVERNAFRLFLRK